MTEDTGDSSLPIRLFHETADDYAGKHYDDAIRSFMTVRQSRVLELVDGLELREGAEALDAGCGPGYLVEALAQRGLVVSALDAAEGMLNNARRRLERASPRRPVSFALGDIEDLPYEDSSFDLVCSNGVIEYLSGDRTVLREMYRVLRPGGYLVLPVTNAWSPINSFDRPVEFLKRQGWFRGPFNAALRRFGMRPLLPRHFRVRRHSPRRFRTALEKAGFGVVDHLYFFFLPWPRPMDKFFPRASSTLGGRMERLGRSPVGLLGEGFLTLAQKPGDDARRGGESEVGPRFNS